MIEKNSFFFCTRYVETGSKLWILLSTKMELNIFVLYKSKKNNYALKITCIGFQIATKASLNLLIIPEANFNPCYCFLRHTVHYTVVFEQCSNLLMLLRKKKHLENYKRYNFQYNMSDGTLIESVTRRSATHYT